MHVWYLQLFHVAELCGLVPDHPPSTEQIQLSHKLLQGSTMMDTDTITEGKSSVSSAGVIGVYYSHPLVYTGTTHWCILLTPAGVYYLLAYTVLLTCAPLVLYEQI